MTQTSSVHSAVVKFLASPESYPEKPTKIDTKETHISHVFMTQQFAYKLKKPVCFEFLDFSSVSLRKQACENELLLNRRLAPDVYLDVLPVCQDGNGTFNIDNQGVPVDWLVKMRRLDDSKTLLALLKKGTQSDTQLSSLVSLLTQFYQLQLPAPLKSKDYILSLENHIESNRDDLMLCMQEQKEQIEFGYSAQIRFVNLMHTTLCERVRDQRIVNGHGDLRPEHIYFDQEPLVIDCIEFNDEYRQNDILDELAFLAMECDQLGAVKEGDAILQGYYLSSNDHPDTTLVTFYKCYRAFVRAKVAALRLSQLPTSEKEEMKQILDSYLRLANQYSQMLGPKLIISVGGLMGSGKSTLATIVAEQLKAAVLRTDVIRDEIHERGENDSYGKHKYSAKAREHVYTVMLQRLDLMFRSTPTLVLDGTFSTTAFRSAARESADKIGAKYFHVECACPKGISLQRIVSRQQDQYASEATPDLYDQQFADYESCQQESDIIHIDTTLPMDQQTECVIARVVALIE